MDAEQWRVDKAAELVVLPERTAVPLPCPDLPELVLAAIAAVQVRIKQSSLGVPALVEQPMQLWISHATAELVWSFAA